MEFKILFEDGPEIGQKPMNSQSKYDATEGHTMRPEPHTKATQRCEFL